MTVALASIQIVIAGYLGIRYKYIHKEKLLSRENYFLGLEFCIAVVIIFLLMGTETYSLIEKINFFITFTLLQVIALIDLKMKIISNFLIIIGCGMKIVLLIAELIFCPETILFSFLRAILGLGVYLLAMLTLSFISKHGIGYGDVKLFAYLGLSLGVSDTYYILFYAALFASVYAAYAVLIKKESKSTKIPFGPFAYLGFIAVYFSTFIKG